MGGCARFSALSYIHAAGHLSPPQTQRVHRHEDATSLTYGLQKASEAIQNQRLSSAVCKPPTTHQLAAVPALLPPRRPSPVELCRSRARRRHRWHSHRRHPTQLRLVGQAARLLRDWEPGACKPPRDGQAMTSAQAHLMNLYEWIDAPSPPGCAWPCGGPPTDRPALSTCYAQQVVIASPDL